MKFLVQAVIEIPIVIPIRCKTPEEALDACCTKLNTYIVKSANVTIKTTTGETTCIDAEDIQIKYISVTEEPAD